MKHEYLDLVADITRVKRNAENLLGVADSRWANSEGVEHRRAWRLIQRCLGAMTEGLTIAQGEADAASVRWALDEVGE